MLDTKFSTATQPFASEPDTIPIGNNRYFDPSGAYITIIAKVPKHDPYLLCGETPELRQYSVSVAVVGFLPDILNEIRQGLSEIEGLKDGEYTPYISLSGARGSKWRQEISGKHMPKSEDIIAEVKRLLEKADAHGVLFMPEEAPFKNALKLR